MAVQTPPKPVVMPPAAIAALRSAPIGPLGGTANKVLWTDGTSIAGVLTVEAGQHLGAHAHRASHHHMWILDGEAVILGEELGPGSYVHIPSGVDHDIDARDTDGCTVFYLYLFQPGS